MSDENKAFEQDIYKKTSESDRELIKEFPTYKELMESFAVGENEVELRKRFMLKKLDETWITAIEDALPSLDQIIRNPQFRLQEKEEVLPVEISKHINGRSVMHLSQHTENITDIRQDGSVVPSKLLNVFQEDTVLTYENKFINTLVNRLYAFVAIRYNGAKECGEDEKNTKLSISQKFEHKDYSGNIKLEIEVGQPPDEHEVIKNYVYTSDLWKRMEKIMEVINEYMATPFIMNMGKNFIRPPVLRTNTILKNPLFKDCLSLWEFIEGYQTTGYEALVQEDLITATDKLLEDMYNSIAEQYVLFQAHIKNGFDDEKALDSRLLKINPSIKDTFDDINESEFDYKTLIPGILKNEGLLDAPSEEIELAILVALAADAMMWEDEIDEEVSVIDDKGNINYRYKFSIIARLIKAQLPTQDYYNELRNDLLEYKGVKSLLSWSRDLYKLGRKPVARINVKGKTVFVYLPLDPSKYDKDHYHHLDVSKEGKEVEYPFLLKVRSPRACKYAKQLIAEIMASYGVEKDAKYKVRDFHLPEMSIEELLERDLARPLDKNGPWSFDWNFEDTGFKYNYIYSFIAKLIRSGEERQEFYNEIKNHLLSYKKVKSSISWPRELFRAGREKVCQLKVKGKTLCVYLPLDPSKFDAEHYHHEDVRVEGKENEFGLMLRVKSNRAVKYAKELIDVVMANLGLVQVENYVVQGYKYAYKSLEEMLAEDLARRIGEKAPVKPVTEEEPTPVTPVDEDVVVKDGIRYRYIYSYSARLIRSGEERQDFYNKVKNDILSYKKVSSRISWGHELFKLGRIKFAELKVKGKTLCVYLPLNPDNYDADRLHFKDMRVEGKEVEFPMMMKVKSDRACKYVAELIAYVMAQNSIVRLDEYVEQDYRLAYMSVEEMLVSDPVLAKLVEDNTSPVEIKPVEEVKVEEPAPVEEPVEEDVVVKDGIRYRYVYSYSARMIRSGGERQDFYNAVKNNILSYKKVNSKISWNHELFKLGRIKIAQLKVKGKTLCVYLPLDPDKYEQERLHFKDMRVEGKEVEFPMMMKVKSDRAVKYVAELIADVMANNNIAKLDEHQEVDYRLPFMSIEQMLTSDPVLAKLIEDNSSPVAIKAEEVVSEVEPEPIPELVVPAVSEDEEIVVKDGIVYKYKFSFAARLIRSGDDRQELYNAVKNDILSYKKVNSKISWGHEFFKLGRIKIAQMKVKGKTLCVYLPLNPDKYDANRLFFKDVRKEGKEVDFPMMMKVKSDRAVKYVAELITDVMANNGINKVDDYAYVDYKLPNMSVEEMLVSDPVLVKLIIDNSNAVDFKTSTLVEETPVVEEKVEEETLVISDDEEAVVKDGVKYKYKFSYSARLIRSGEDRQNFYNVIKNNILSYKKVNSKISWGHELFKLGRIKIAQLKVKGKTLCVYLPLNPDKYDANRLFFKDVRKEGKDVEFPMMMKVKSDRACKYVAELIEDVMAENNIVKLDNYVEQDYRLANLSIEEMLISNPALVKLTQDNLDTVTTKPVKEAVLEEMKQAIEEYSSKEDLNTTVDESSNVETKTSVKQRKFFFARLRMAFRNRRAKNK